MTKTITFNKIIATQHGGILKALAGSVMTASLLFSQGGAADNNSCNALLTLGLYNTTQTTDSTKSNSVALSQFCSSDYRNFQTAEAESSSQAITVRASSGWFSAAGSTASAKALSKEQIIQMQSNLCTSGFNSSSYLDESTRYARDVYQGSLDAWNKCNELNASGLKFNVNPSLDLGSLSIELSAMSTGSSLALKGVIQAGGKAICSTTLPPKGTSYSGKVITVDQSTFIPFNNSSILSIRCNREMIDDPTLGKYAEATTLTFSTTAGDVVVPMAAIGKVSRVSYDQAVADVKNITNQKIGVISSTIDGLSNSLDATKKQVTTLETNLGTLNANLIDKINPSLVVMAEKIASAAKTSEISISNGYWIDRHNSGGISGPIDMGSIQNRVCFLTETYMEEIDSDGEYASCQIFQKDGKWFFQAKLGGGGGPDSDVICAAQCISWKAP